MSSFSRSVEKTIKEYNMLENGDTIIVALSGGADSVSLLYYLNSIKEKYSISLKAAHLNHNIRGSEAIRDESFVKELCKKLNVELFLKSVNIPEIAAENKISEELAGREERYKFFSELSERFGAKTATAHNADDNLETVVFNLIRGAGVSGMSGIKPVRGNIIRPLIETSREEIERYVAENSLSYVLDSTNLKDDYTRNKIRHKIVPVMKEINRSVVENVSGETKIFENVNSYLELKSNEIIEECRLDNGYDAVKLQNIPDNIKQTVIYEILKRNGISPEYKHISLIVSILKSGAVDLKSNVRAVCKQGYLRFVRTDGDSFEFSEKELKLPMEFSFNGNNYSVKEIKNTAESDVLKLSVLNKNPVFRTRRAGDRFTLPKRKVTKSLKKLFNELKIPEEKRDKLLLLTSGSEVLWIEGIGACETAVSYDENGFTIKKNR